MKRDSNHWKIRIKTCTLDINADDNIRVGDNVPNVSDNKNKIDVNVRFC